MKKFAFVLVTLFVAFFTISSCAKQSDEPKKETATELNAAYSPSVQGADIYLVSADEAIGAEYIQVSDDATPEDPAKKFDFATILNVVLGVVSVILGTFLTKFKTKLSQIIAVGTAVIHAGVLVDEALADNNVSKEEIKAIRESANDVRNTFKQLISFKKE